LSNEIKSFEIQGEVFYYFDIKSIVEDSKKLKKLPIVLKILLEANLRNAKDDIEFNEIIKAFKNRTTKEINLYPSRIIMQDFTGIPIIVDLASIRDTVVENGGDVSKVNPKIMVDLVIDHSLDVYSTSNKDSSEINIEKECELNKERYEFIKWAQNSFSNFRVVPPGSGICHQVNLEYLSTILHLDVVDNKNFIYPETIIGTDSHTTMINSLGVLGWGVGEVEAKSVMLGMPISFHLPKVVGVNIHGKLKEAITSSDLVLTLTKILKESNIAGKLVEFHGEGLRYLTLEDRSTISNMAPEYDAISSFFAIDDKTIDYFNKTRGTEDYGHLLKEYLQRQNLFYTNEDLDFDEVIDLNLDELEPTIAGPNKPEETIKIEHLKKQEILKSGFHLKDLDIVIASITSCTTTSNPYLIIHAALVAKKAYEFGLHKKEHVKTSFAPASLAVKQFLVELDLLKYLEYLGFHIVGYGCSTCCGNSGSLEDKYEFDIEDNKLNVCSVTSGNKNFEGRIHSLVKSNYLMSPSLVIVYALIGNTKFDLFEDVIGTIDDKDIYLKDLWPSSKDVGEYMGKLDYTLYKNIYKDIFKGNEFWQKLEVENSDTFNWNKESTYIQATKFYDEQNLTQINIENGRVLALLGDNITTDDISPLGQISLHSPASKYLENMGIKSFEYNTFGSRRGNAQVMLRGTFDNPRLKNKMVSKVGGYTFDYEANEIVPIFDKAQRFKELNKPLIIIAGENYGIGSPRDWAAKGTKLLGVKSVIAKSFDNNHRKNLISFGVLPLQFIDDDIESLKLKGDENITIVSDSIQAEGKVKAHINRGFDEVIIELKSRLDTKKEVEYYKNGGIFPFLIKN